MKICLPFEIGAKRMKIADYVSGNRDREYKSCANPKGSVQVRIGSYFGQKKVLS